MAVQLGLQLVKLTLELFGGAIEGGERVGCGRLCAHVMAVAFDGNFAHFLVGNSGISLF